MMASILPARSSSRLVCNGQARPACAMPFLRRSGRSSRSAQCSAARESEQLQAQVVKTATLSSAVGTFLAAGNVSAAQELANAVAKSDNRFAIMATVSLPVLGWVGFNIFGPAINQVAAMQNKNKQARNAMGLGLGLASLAIAQQASASPSEVAELAAGDNRALILLTVLLPVAGWVLFNITGPALAQLKNMSLKRDKIEGGGKKGSKTGTRKRGLAGAIGLTGASMLAVQQADAASEVAQLAAGDNRLSIILTVLLPVAGWVLFNISGPALAQLNNMNKKLSGATGGTKKR